MAFSGRFLRPSILSGGRFLPSRRWFCSPVTNVFNLVEDIPTCSNEVMAIPSQIPFKVATYHGRWGRGPGQLVLTRLFQKEVVKIYVSDIENPDDDVGYPCVWVHVLIDKGNLELTSEMLVKQDRIDILTLYMRNLDLCFDEVQPLSRYDYDDRIHERNKDLEVDWNDVIRRAKRNRGMEPFEEYLKFNEILSTRTLNFMYDNLGIERKNKVLAEN